MSRRYQRKLSLLPNSRKPEAFYLDVLRYRLAGKPSASIVKHLQSNAVTVSRTLKKLEQALADTHAAELYFIRLGQMFVPRMIPMIRGQWGLLKFLLEEDPRFTMMDFHSCMSDCNIKGNARKYVTTHVWRHDYISEWYGFEVPLVLNADKVDNLHRRCMKCLYCPMGREYRDGLVRLFHNAPPLFTDYATNLHNFRIRDASAYRLYCFYKFSSIMTLIRMCLVAKVNKMHGQDPTYEHLHEQLAVFLEGITNDLFRQIRRGEEDSAKYYLFQI